ncbi:response regulator transcription factor [Shewanella sp. AS16]|uniref:response regulator transcription factor n=1 Tax=Shewanella sp. AS16 TaxID=2907625 RepID=UPI001F356F6B|nr:response regulator transcription factor [Shewanella sp. AS16]MCE9687243.1 response regulator transcription factor [Shewanella sp. AS16]
MSKILLVDDDSVYRALVTEALMTEGHELLQAEDGLQALERLAYFSPDILLLAPMMPDLHDLALMLSLKTQIPVIIMSASDNQALRIRCHEMGADDFLTKPIHIETLSIRIGAILRRVALSRAWAGRKHERREGTEAPHRQAEKQATEGVTEWVSFDESRYCVHLGQRCLTLTQTEFRLFRYLFERRGQVVTKQELQLGVLHKEHGRFDRNLDMHISNTRRKLAQTQLPRSLIATVRGRGYCFAPV